MVFHYLQNANPDKKIHLCLQKRYSNHQQGISQDMGLGYFRQTRYVRCFIIDIASQITHQKKNVTSLNKKVLSNSGHLKIRGGGGGVGGHHCFIYTAVLESWMYYCVCIQHKKRAPQRTTRYTPMWKAFERTKESVCCQNKDYVWKGQLVDPLIHYIC